MKIETIKQSSLLLTEKLLSSVSRYALTFYCLTQLSDNDANKFFHQNSILIFLFVACHFGIDNYLIGRIKNGLDVDKFYKLRMLSANLTAILYLFVFGNEITVTSILLAIALIGVALPIMQTKALISGVITDIVRWRLIPEILSASTRTISMAAGINDPNIMLLMFFSSEIISGLIFFLRFKRYCHFFSFGFQSIQNIHINEIRPLIFGTLTIILIFILQRGDVLLWTTINPGEMSSSLRLVVKSQQFFDMAGILSAAALPLILRLKANQQGYTPIVLVAIFFSISQLVLFTISNFEAVRIVTYSVLGAYELNLIPVFASLGLGTYVAMMQLDFSLRQIDILLSLFLSVLVKLLLFFIMIDDMPIEYSLASSFTAFSVFIFAGSRFSLRRLGSNSKT